MGGAINLEMFRAQCGDFDSRNVINLNDFRALIGNVNGGQVTIDSENKLGKVNNGFWARHFKCFVKPIDPEVNQKLRIELYKALLTEWYTSNSSKIVNSRSSDLQNANVGDVSKSMVDDTLRFLENIKAALGIEISKETGSPIPGYKISATNDSCVDRSTLKSLIHYFDYSSENIANFCQKELGSSVKSYFANYHWDLRAVSEMVARNALDLQPEDFKSSSSINSVNEGMRKGVRSFISCNINIIGEIPYPKLNILILDCVRDLIAKIQKDSTARNEFIAALLKQAGSKEKSVSSANLERIFARYEMLLLARVVQSSDGRDLIFSDKDAVGAIALFIAGEMDEKAKAELLK